MVLIDCGTYIDDEKTKRKIPLYLDGTLLKNLTEIKQVVLKKDFDYVAVISGRVGKGKSTFAMQLSKFFDNSFDLSRICFSAEEFIRVTTTSPNYSSVMLDESFESLNTKIGQSPAFLKIQNHLNIIRSKNLFIFLVLPSFFDLHKSVALYRTWNLFHVYGEGFGGRGRFSAYSPDNKRMLYIKGSKYNDYNAVKGNFRGTFTARQVIPRELYETKKLEHLKNQNELAGTSRIRDIHKVRLIGYLRFKEGWKIKRLTEVVGMSKQSIIRILKIYQETMS